MRGKTRIKLKKFRYMMRVFDRGPMLENNPFTPFEKKRKHKHESKTKNKTKKVWIDDGNVQQGPRMK